MQIVYAASECAPWARTGGLGEVLRGLPRQIASLGHKVAVYIPYYRQVREQAPDKHYAVQSITIPFQYYSRFAAILDGGVHDGVQMYFVDCPELFDREFLYGTSSGPYQDNWERFALFSRAVLEGAKLLGAPDLFHAHDWQTALLPVYLRTLYYFDPVLRNRGAVLTIHNAGYQGRYPAATVERLLFPWEIFTAERAEYFGEFNFLKAGIVYSDRLTTVSPRYAEEIQTLEYGQGLDGVLRKRAADLRGILNGVDHQHWNPAKDGNIAAHYTPENLAGKRECRADLLSAFGLELVEDATPVIGIVSRFAVQKGFDLLEEIAGRLSEMEVAVVALGSGEPVYEKFFRDWAFWNKSNVAVRIGYNDALAHKIEAGADLFLMPSLYEPCGLNQIYSLKYGTVPVVRATGGLDDTIEEWNPRQGSGTGFKFTDVSGEALLAAIERALAAFEDQAGWKRLMLNGMARNYSWEQPAREYAAVYEEAASRLA
jgi:starch synthase